MDFRLDADQQALQAAAREFLGREVTSAVVRAAFEGPDGDAPELYRRMAELGWLAITVPPPRGLGLGLVEQAVVVEQMGYVNAPGPYFSTACLAVPALVALGAEDLVDPFLRGERRATVALDPGVVLDAQLADAFLVVADGRVIFHDRAEVEVTPFESIDGTRRFGAVRARGGGRELGPARELDRVVDGATAVLCAEMVGGMQWVLDTTVAYAKARHQFGRPIGSFQAVKHRLADMLLQTESSRSAAYYAAYANARGLPDAAFAASVAKAYVSDAAVWVAGEGIQLHGGIGFTWEHDMHLYFKRAKVNEVLLGDATYHRERALRLDPEAVAGS